MMAYPEESAKAIAELPYDDDLLVGGLLSTEELAALLGIDPSTLRRWRTSEPPAGPPFVPISDRVTKYWKSDVRRWLDLRRVATSAPTGKTVSI